MLHFTLHERACDKHLFIYAAICMVKRCADPLQPVVIDETLLGLLSMRIVVAFTVGVLIILFGICSCLIMGVLISLLSVSEWLG